MDQNSSETAKLSPMREINRALLKSKNANFLKSARSKVSDPILLAVFESAADAILVFDETKKIVLANEAAARLSGWDLEELTRDGMHERYKLYQGKSKTPLQVQDEPLEIAMRDKSISGMEGLVLGEGLPPEGMWVTAHAAPILDENGGVVGGVTVISDISERIRLQNQRDCLVALIAHDVKNHLAAETIFLSFVDGTIGDKIDPALRDMISDLKRGNEKFTAMTESLVELSRSESFAATGHGSVMDLKHIVQVAIDSNQLASLQAEVSIVLSAASEPPVYGIPAVIGQVFHNIMLNAIEASEKHGSIEVKLSSSAAGGARIEIIDHGIGMSQDEVEALFDAKRVATHERKTSHSTGFGLYLSAMLIEGQGGTISCTSEIGKGTCVAVEFPPVPTEHA